MGHGEFSLMLDILDPGERRKLLGRIKNESYMRTISEGSR